MIKPDVYVEGDYLVFKDFETYDSIAGVLNNGSLKFIKEFETKLGFKSAFTYRQESLEKLNTFTETESISFLNSLSKEGYFNSESQEFTYPFYNESRSIVLNPKGKVKIDNTFYHFEGTFETVVPDLSIKENKGNTNLKPIVINLMELGLQTKSAEILFDNTTASGQQRLTMRVCRENEAIYGDIIENGQIVWGLMGYHWEVKLRFHSWRQRALSKSDENTYFHWIANQFTIGGNDSFWYYNYSNPNTATSPWTAIYYLELYDSGVIEETTHPNTHIDAECWSDRFTTPKNYVDYSD